MHVRILLLHARILPLLETHMIMKNEAAPSYDLPPVGENPSTLRQGTSPGSFAQKGRVGTAWTFSSPDTPGMPAPSDKTAWDFMPPDWTRDAAGRWHAPAGFIA